MAIVELDPLFIRALRLLHSKSKDSDVQLKALLDECIRQRKAGLPISIPTPQPASAASSASNQGASGKGRDAEKNLDRLKRDLSQLVPGGVTTKKPRLDVASGSKLSSSSMTPSPTASVVIEESEEMDIDFQSLNDCTCCICKSFNQETGNKLMECHTCQNLYHQECHNPAITDEEVADPRLVWNCSNCSATIQQSLPSKPQSGKSSPKPSKTFSSSGSRGTSSPPRGGSGLPPLLAPPPPPSSFLSSTKSSFPSSFSRSQSRAPRGSSGLGPTASTSSGSGGSSGNGGSSSLSNVDKRLQMMKKKASGGANSGNGNASASISQRKSK